MFGRKKTATPTTTLTHVAGDKQVKVGGFIYRQEDAAQVFGGLGCLTETTMVAVLRPMPPNDYNPTPIEVWMGGRHIGWVADEDSLRYWKTLSDAYYARNTLATCAAHIKTDNFGGVSKVRLLLPAHVKL